jgi:hypothetical protein
MQDPPLPTELLAAAIKFMRTPVTPEGAAHAAFITRVAANGLDIVRRELEDAPAYDAAETERLRALGFSGSLEEMNRALCDKLAAGDMSLETPGVTEHLWANTMAKLAVDQPNYSGYRAALAERGEA